MHTLQCNQLLTSHISTCLVKRKRFLNAKKITNLGLKFPYHAVWILLRKQALETVSIFVNVIIECPVQPESIELYRVIVTGSTPAE